MFSDTLIKVDLTINYGHTFLQQTQCLCTINVDLGRILVVKIEGQLMHCTVKTCCLMELTNRRL